MQKKNKISYLKKDSRGNMLLELLLSVALCAVIVPFIFKYQQSAIQRAQNLKIRNQMTEIQVALERYIVENRDNLLNTIGRTITRVELSELGEFGLPDSIQETDDKYQLRILKSQDSTGSATLQGVIVRDSDDISPLRTREIVNMSGGSMGFVDGTHAYGTFGSWHSDTIDLGIRLNNGLIETTAVNRDAALYLWRVPSENPSDALMMSPLNLGGHDIKNAAFINANFAEFAENLTAENIATNSLIFQNRTTINSEYKSKSTTVSGTLSADGKNMEINGSLSLDNLGKFSSLTANNLWVSNMTLGGLSVETNDGLALLKVNQYLDMTSGHINAIYTSVGFTGSMTPRLVVQDRIEDSRNSEYYWDASSKTANFVDANFIELNRMAALATYYEGDPATISGQIFGAVSANKNATVADYMNAINKIQKQVQEKYQDLILK